ncbi:hypothetical protein F5J12DRAFT_913279 [Pisolithus orientalis]|uniref:uncharacterized protein n=1 Tax=Pisolithus orientalis TaxID=936130 RepID=UPI0022257162|nr:uncharacterized protein F5J12DRAFT_913279 [Pisolithus orientalis]KAI6006332.1 hypothetical protein F5J12DRAFT_913279 [Pisolithus orientalis]
MSYKMANVPGYGSEVEDRLYDLTSYSTVVFVSGGAGQGDLDLGASRAKVIELFKTRNPCTSISIQIIPFSLKESVSAFLTLPLPRFAPVPQQSTYTPLHISSYYALAVKRTMLHESGVKTSISSADAIWRLEVGAIEIHE